MTAIEIARSLAALGQEKDACQAYTLVIHQAQEPVEELEAAIYLLQNGGDYKIAYSTFVSLYNRGQFQEDCLSIMTQAFYEPNVKLLKSRYQSNCKLLGKYPYAFRRDFLDFEALPIRFYPFDDNRFVPYYRKEKRFGDYIDVKKPVISRNFFQNLENPILAQDVFSQYELEYLNDNVRKSEYVARENHIYLHYTDWAEFCAYLQCLNLRRILENKKVVFLFENEIERYPIDFKEEFGIDYAQYSVKPIAIREVNRMIWHTQLSSHNGGDFFNEIFDGHPNLITMPSIMLDTIQKTVYEVNEKLNECKDFREAQQRFDQFDQRVLQDLFFLRDRTEKDILVAVVLSDGRPGAALDVNARIAPALFFQPHFANMEYELYIDEEGRTVLNSEQYNKIKAFPVFQNFRYIKTFTPMRRITTSYGATVKFMYTWTANEEEKKTSVIPDAVSIRVLNRSFMIDPQDRLYADCVLVRFEDGKLNPKATFTALAAFLDLPYTESMTYCSLWGERNPESLRGNDLGFSTAAIYRTYDEYANDAERCFVEFFMRDAYAYYGYDFHYYKGEPLGEEEVAHLLEHFTTLDGYIEKTWKENICIAENITVDRKRKATPEEAEAVQDGLMRKLMEAFRDRRLQNARLLLRGLHFVNKNGQPLRMMPKLELDPALLEQPLYH